MLNDNPLSGDTGAPSDLEASVEAAAVLLSLAMRDTERPVSDLGGALTRLSARLHGGARPAACANAVAPARPNAREQDNLQESLAGDLAICIQSLQFHDRLIQQLAAVRGFLASLADHHALGDVAGFGAQRWEELLTLVRKRLTADSHRQLFELLMRTGAIDGDARSEMASDGSVELF
jgi:hypothetical protein